VFAAAVAELFLLHAVRAHSEAFTAGVATARWTRSAAAAT
jgi:hypothetical protein